MEEDRSDDLLLGTKEVDAGLAWLSKNAKKAGEWYKDASADQAGLGDDMLRLLGGGAKNVATVAGAVYEAPVLKQGFQALDALSYYGGKVGGAAAKAAGVDPRIGGAIGNVAGEVLTGFGAKAGLKYGAKAAKATKNYAGAFYGLASGTAMGTGAHSATGSLRKLRNLDEINKLKKVEQLKLDDFRKTPEGIGLLEDSYELYKKQGNLEGLEGIDEFIVRKKNAVNYEKRTGLSVASQNIRDLEAAKRAIRTDIPRSSVEALAEKYGQPKEIVDLFLDQQKAGKKILTDRVAKINKNLKQRFKDNPEFAAAYQKKLKASLGHIQAADTFDEAADILSNLELENFFINARRAHNNELPGELSRALGASRNLNEEFLKFIDPQLGNFWKELRGPQKRRFRNLVQNEGMDVNEALEKVGFGKPRPVDGLSIKKTKPTQWSERRASSIKRDLELGINAPRRGELGAPSWKVGDAQVTWYPESMQNPLKGYGQIDILEQTGNKVQKGFKALNKDFENAIKEFPSGTEVILNMVKGDKKREAIYTRLFNQPKWKGIVKRNPDPNLGWIYTAP